MTEKITRECHCYDIDTDKVVNVSNKYLREIEIERDLYSRNMVLNSVR